MNIFALAIPILFTIMIYGLGILALVYLIKALRIYIKKIAKTKIESKTDLMMVGCKKCDRR